MAMSLTIHLLDGETIESAILRSFPYMFQKVEMGNWPALKREIDVSLDSKKQAELPASLPAKTEPPVVQIISDEDLMALAQRALLVPRGLSMIRELLKSRKVEKISELAQWAKADFAAELKKAIGE